MPELPEVETVCRALAPHLVGRELKRVHARVPSLRNPLNERTLNRFAAGKTVLDLRRRGKYMICELAGARAILLHLGMSGSCRISPVGADYGPHDRIVVDLDDGNAWRFVDPRRFGLFLPVALPGPGAEPQELAGLGPEPLGETFTGEHLFERSRGRKTAVKAWLMDQATVVGVGNIYANESLFHAGIRPDRPAGRVTRRECDRLVRAVQDVLNAAIRCGGTTISDHRLPDGSEGGFCLELNVYGRQGQSCPTCGRPIQRILLGQRSTFFCSSCQR